MILKINGVDITPYIESGGYKYSINDVDKGAGRTLDGTMWRGRVAQKVRLDITCMPLETASMSVVLQAIDPEYVTVEYLDPKLGSMRTAVFYSNNKPATVVAKTASGYRWGSVTFPLIER